MQIVVVYVDAKEEFIAEIDVAVDATVQQAIELSGVLERFPNLSLSALSVGIYGQLVELNSVLQQHDRVEIYRSLKRDPKESRRLRAEVQHKVDD